MKLRLPLWLVLPLMVPGPAEAWPVDQDEIDGAIRRGVDYLQSTQNRDGTWQGLYRHRCGGIALPTLALLECGVPADDPSVARPVARLRNRAPQEMQTYDLALLIMLFDRLTREDQARQLRAVAPGSTGRSKRLKSGRILVDQQIDDSRMIVELGRRLGNGQGPGGSWTYNCTSPADGDNSNTQFAVLGLWIAGQHGLDARQALERCADHFRSSQQPDGGWGYMGLGGMSTPSMTCAGLTALATRLGLETELRQVNAPPEQGAAAIRDQNVEQGFEYLARYLQHESDVMGVFRHGGLGSHLYSYWSLERVGVLYGLAEVGTVDWYDWGAERLIRNQHDNGSWISGYGPEIGAAFALLFLSRSNVSPELSHALAGKLDLETRTMKAFLPGSNTAKVLGQNEAVMLLVELDGAAAERQREILDLLRDRKGAAYTQALSDAVAKVDPGEQAYARRCLVERMQRMTVKTLRDKLAGDDAEVRLAAVEAAGQKKAKDLIPELIELLKHPDDPTWQASHRALCKLTGEDFGPRPNAGTVQRFESLRAWRDWWESFANQQTP